MDLSTVLGVGLAWLSLAPRLSRCRWRGHVDRSNLFLVVLGMYRGHDGGVLLRSEAAAQSSDEPSSKSVDVQEVIDQAIELNTISRKGVKDEDGKRLGCTLSFRVVFAANKPNPTVKLN